MIVVMILPDDNIERGIYQAVSRGYEWLFQTGQGKANWKLVDHTALVAIAMTLREPKNSHWIMAIRKWLVSQQSEIEPETFSWDESVSDTSMALIALIRMGVIPKDPAIVNGISFLRKVFHYNKRMNWEDEPWETSWAIMAIAESGDSQAMDEACQGARWLLEIQEPNGAVIAPHYTAYFIKVVQTICKKQTIEGYCILDESRYKESANRAADYLLSNIDKDTLWTGEPWSNGEIVWALASTGRFPFDNPQLLNMVVDWFVKKQGADGNWYDPEDTACSILGLLALLKSYLLHNLQDKALKEDVDTMIYNHLRRMYEPPKLMMEKKFVEVLEDGTTTLNFSPTTLKVSAILFAIVSGFTVLYAIWDFLVDILGI